MKSQKTKMHRILCLLISAVLILSGVLTACSQIPDAGTKPTETIPAEKTSAPTTPAETTPAPTTPVETEPPDTESPDTETADIPAAVFSVDVDNVKVPDEGVEVVQTLALRSSAEIDGTLTSDDITLGGSFKNMKVADISNDAETITLTLSGVPVFEGAPTLGYLGEIEIAGKYFGSDKAVSAGVFVTCLSGEAPGASYFYPFLDSVIDNDASKELHIVLRPYSGSFAKDFSEDKITLEGVLENSEIVSLEQKNEDFELVVNVNAELDIHGTENTFGTITLAAGSLTNNSDEVSYTRDYSIETAGRALTANDLEKIKEVVKPKDEGGTNPLGDLFSLGSTIYGYYGNAMTAYKTVTSILSAFGMIEKNEVNVDEQRHQEIMDAFNEISGKLEALQEDVTAVRSYAVDNKRALEDLSLITTEDYLAQFHSHYDAMIKYTNEIANALDQNGEKIWALAEEYYVEGEEGKAMSEAEINNVIEEFGKKICDMKQSNYYTIGEKLKLLETEYTTSLTFLKNNSANPISRYCDLYKYTDNFSTTSLIDKQLYALDLDCQFDRTLSYLMLLGGKTSQKENVDLFANSYFPDVVKEATNQNGDPYCYLMKSFVQIATDTPNACYKAGKDTHILYTEDIVEFEKRMHGRTLKEELVLAGFDSSVFLKQYTNFNNSDFGSGAGYTANDRYVGLAFSYKIVKGNYPHVNKIKTWYGRMDGIFNYMKDDKNSYVIEAEGIYYEYEQIYKGKLYPICCCGYISKGGTFYTAGWYMIEPLTYLKRV